MFDNSFIERLFVFFGSCYIGSKNGDHWAECRRECEYDFGIDYRLTIKIIDTKYKNFDGTEWIDYEFNAISEWIHIDDKIENELLKDERDVDSYGNYKIASCGGCRPKPPPATTGP